MQTKSSDRGRCSKTRCGAERAQPCTLVRGRVLPTSLPLALWHDGAAGSAKRLAKTGKFLSPANFAAASAEAGKSESRQPASSPVLSPRPRWRENGAYGVLTIEVIRVEQTCTGKPKIRPPCTFKLQCAQNDSETLETLSRSSWW